MPLKDRLNLAQDPVYLVDGSAFIYRGFYAFRDMSTHEGFPTNAVYVVLRMMLKILREERPAFMGFFLDGKGKTFRDDIYAEYKAQRQATPEDLIRQIEPIKQGLALLGLPIIVSEGSEADDCIASVADRLKGERPVVIVGADKDLRQCLDARVWLWDPSGKQEKLEGVAEFTAATGLSPAAWPDFQALTGDSADNIPGVPGIGPKSATELMAGRASLEELWRDLAEVPEKYRKKLTGQEEASYRWRDLTRLRTDFCQDLSLERLTLAAPDIAGLKEFIRQYEFGSLVRELPRDMAREISQGPGTGQASGPSHGKTAAQAASAAQAGSKGAKGAKGKAAAAQGKNLFDFMPQGAGQTAPAAEAASAVAGTAGTAAGLPPLSGLETGCVPPGTGTDAHGAGADAGAFALGLGEAEWRFAGSEAELAAALSDCASLAVPSLKELLGRDAAWQNVPLARVRDLGLMAYLLNPEEREYGLPHLLAASIGDPDFTPAPHGAPGLAALELGRTLAKRLEISGMGDLYATLELPLVPVLTDMERAGVAIDLTAFTSFLAEVTEGIDTLTAKIYAAAGEEFNVRSSQQLGRILFEKMGLKPRGKTPGGQPSTSQAALEKMAGDSELIDLVLEFRGLEKMRSTYLEPLPRLVDGQGRIHTTFNNLSTATGRLSSSGPNLQNIPIRGPMGGRMRACFTAAPGKLLASADYSQIELRLLAHLCGDPGLTSAFRAGEDIHARTAAILHGKEPDEVTPAERRGAKTINFGLLYGMGPQRLSRELKITLTEAKDFIARYFERMPRVKAFFEGVEQEARRDGFVTTMLGRRRLLPGLRSRNDNEQSQAVRQAINTRVQGSAADIIKLAMIRAHEDAELKRLDARLILQVHDELLVEAPAATAQAAGERLAAIMTHVADLDVPLAVEWGVGKNWAEAH
ncbi:DNA polymerase I [Desulfovibrio sp. X2]|uniref:DNA polymerase I n=1 Tax=Desulfovibrio sp. X2 TaxID=941449 RepID=UPI00035876F5|nr:DNA polymerase I [Desulfovibrio sp. X2]EPR43722.1 DNA polymerase I [Desulfovibrio sp. X2]